MTDTDIALAKKRKANELFIYVIVEALGTFVMAFGLLFFCIGDMQNDLELKNIGIVVSLLGSLFSGIFALGGCARLAEAEFLPTSIRQYGRVGYILFLLFMLAMSLSLRILVFILIVVIPFYGLIPQYFIARWLAKEAEEGTMEPVPDEAINNHFD
jgi:hypothetical protein